MRTRATVDRGSCVFFLFARLVSMPDRVARAVRPSALRSNNSGLHEIAFCKLLAIGLAVLLGDFASSPAVGANITVNANQIVTNTIAGVSTPATMGGIGIGMNMSVYYNNIDKSYLSPALDVGGSTIVRYPGGNYSDIYHWTNNVATGGYSAGTSNFGSFAKSILNGSGLAKQAMITVDYGENLNSTMGGQPQEAAAWVAYSNSAVDGANATMQLGTDAAGYNWGTVRYWAALRSANPSDANWATDGSVGVVLDASDMPTAPSGNFPIGSFLKIQRAAPLGIQQWEIGNELNGNGYFGTGLNWQNDKHSLATGAARQNDPNLSPTFYGQHLIAFAQAMKAVDPTIKIGGVLNNASNYDPFVLQASVPDPDNPGQNLYAANFMDFGIVHYYPNYSGSTETAATNFISNAVSNIPSTIASERNNYLKQYAAVDARHIPIYITEFGNLGTTLPGVAEGMQTVIDYAGFLQTGVTSTEMWEMVGKSYINDTATLSPAARGSYYSMQALHDFIRPGDTFINSSSTQNSTGIVYAAKRSDGTIAIMILNPNTVAQSIPVTINGDLYKDGGTQYFTSLTANPTQTTVTGLGNHFSASVAGRSIAVLILSPRLLGDFNDDGIVDAADYTVWRDTQGQTGQDLSADFTGPGGIPDGVVDTLDYQFWVDHFGQTASGAGNGASSSAAVPEPSSILLLAASSIAFFCCGRGAFDRARIESPRP
jgi:hypothetical protein